MRTQRGRAEGEARGKPGSSGMKPICKQTPCPGLLSTSSDSFIKSPVSTGMVPVLLLCAPGESPADQRGAAPLPPLRPSARALTEVRSHPGKPGALTGGRFVPPRARSFLDSPPSPPEALPTYPQGSWEHLPGSPVLAAAPGVGGPVPGWVKHRGRAGSGWLPLPGLLTGALRPSSCSSSAPDAHSGLSGLFVS